MDFDSFINILDDTLATKDTYSINCDTDTKLNDHYLYIVPRNGDIISNINCDKPFKLLGNNYIINTTANIIPLIGCHTCIMIAALEQPSLLEIEYKSYPSHIRQILARTKFVKYSGEYSYQGDILWELENGIITSGEKFTNGEFKLSGHGALTLPLKEIKINSVIFNTFPVILEIGGQQIDIIGRQKFNFFQIDTSEICYHSVVFKHINNEYLECFVEYDEDISNNIHKKVVNYVNPDSNEEILLETFGGMMKKHNNTVEENIFSRLISYFF